MNADAAADRSCQVLIAGAGPAGLATALHLLHRRPDLAGRVVALERARHPRPKVCAGGLIPKTMLALQELGLHLTVPAVEVRQGRAVTELGQVDYPAGDVLCTVVRRDRFDAFLAAAARQAGLTIVEDCRVSGARVESDRVAVATSQGSFNAALLVGADGSGSKVRSALFDRGHATVGRALMWDVPVDPARHPEFSQALYRFDFRCIGAGIKGYSWSFPCLIEGQPHLNVGIYDQCPSQAVSPGGVKAPLAQALAQAFPELALPAGGYKAFPIRWYDPAQRFAGPRVMLAGDAAGVDPLMGEGISYAFEHGKLAARAIDRFLRGDGAALAHYDQALHRDSMARKMRRLLFATRHFYGPRHRFYFRLAGLSREAQRIGIDWYNGAGELDEVSVLRLIGKWARAVLFSPSMS